MKLDYYPETDSLYIDLSDLESVETREISEGVQLKELILSKLPSKVRTVAA